MKIVARFLAVILASLVFSLASGFILDRTMLRADYVLPHAKESKIFDAAAQLLPTLAVPQEKRETRDGKALHAKLSDLFTPAYVETKLTDFARQLEKHYREGAPAPTIDLASLATEAQAAGLDIDPATVQPIQLNQETDQHIQNSIGLVRGAQSIALIAAIVLALLLLLISIKLHDYSSLINILVLNAFLLAIVWIILRVAPGPLAGMIPTDIPELKPLTDAGAQLVTRLANAISSQYAVAAIVFVGAAMLVYAIAFISRLRHKPAVAPSKAAKAS